MKERDAKPVLFWVYLALAVVGAILPYAIFIPWVAEHRFAPGLFVEQLFASRPAAIFAADVLLSAAIFVLFAFREGRRLGMRHLWLYPFIVLTVGLCCALPLFLANRERADG